MQFEPKLMIILNISCCFVSSCNMVDTGLYYTEYIINNIIYYYKTIIPILLGSYTIIYKLHSFIISLAAIIPVAAAPTIPRDTPAPSPAA